MPLKKKNKVVIDEPTLSPKPVLSPKPMLNPEPVLNLEPMNVFSPISSLQEQHVTLPSYSGPKESVHPTWDSRKGKSILNDLTIDVDGLF